MNVLHYGLILNQPWNITRGLRDIGIDADCALWGTFGQDWLIPGWDINLEMESASNRRLKMLSFLTDVIEKYDIIHFHSQPTFWYTNLLLSKCHDTKLLSKLGKKMFISFWGCDIRHWNQEFKYPWSPCKVCGLYRRTYCDLCSKKILEISRKYCKKMFSSGDLCVANPDIVWSNLAVNPRELDPSKITQIPEKYKIDRQPGEFVIYHSFGNSETRPDVKGSVYIRKIIDDLRLDGYKIKYLFVDKVPNSDLKYVQFQADLVIDQICAGWYGVTAAECMSIEKPVMSYLRDDILEICPNNDIPIINSNPKTLKQNLVELIEDRERLKEIGKKGREYVMRYHDNRVVSREFLKYYME